MANTNLHHICWSLILAILQADLPEGLPKIDVHFCFIALLYT
jgi:hypothetical protein